MSNLELMIYGTLLFILVSFLLCWFYPFELPHEGMSAIDKKIAMSKLQEQEQKRERVPFVPNYPNGLRSHYFVDVVYYLGLKGSLGVVALCLCVVGASFLKMVPPPAGILSGLIAYGMGLTTLRLRKFF